MPLAMYTLPKIPEPVEKLERLVRKERDAQIQRRYHMLLLMKTGEVKSRTGAGRHLGVHRNTIAGWLELYEESSTKRAVSMGFEKSGNLVPTRASSRFHRA